MGPAVHGDSRDVACGIEADCAQHGSELGANVALEGFKRSVHQFHASGAVLVARGQSAVNKGKGP